MNNQLKLKVLSVIWTYWNCKWYEMIMGKLFDICIYTFTTMNSQNGRPHVPEVSATSCLVALFHLAWVQAPRDQIVVALSLFFCAS